MNSATIFYNTQIVSMNIAFLYTCVHIRVLGDIRFVVDVVWWRNVSSSVEMGWLDETTTTVVIISWEPTTSIFRAYNPYV